jgi:hypothetical protein
MTPLRVARNSTTVKKILSPRMLFDEGRLGSTRGKGITREQIFRNICLKRSLYQTVYGLLKAAWKEKKPTGIKKRTVLIGPSIFCCLTLPMFPLYDFILQEVHMKPARVPITVSLPSNLAESFERLAKIEAKNKSQLFREMLAVYEQRRREEQFYELQRYGVKKAKKKGVLTEADVEKLVFQSR